MASTVSIPESDAEPEDRGRSAATPKELTKTGWKDVLTRVKAEAKEDQLTFMSGGVAFFALIALVPALVALVSVFGLVADPAEVQRQVRDALISAPAEVRELVQSQLEGVTESSESALGVGLVVGIALALFSASAGIVNLIAALNRVYDEHETRNFVKLRATALALTLGAVAFIVLAAVILTVLPNLAEDLGTPARWAVAILRWPALAIAFMFGLGVMYRFGPDRQNATWTWLTPGAILATLIWIAGSGLFSLYTASFASYNETYGALGAIVITMLWLQISALAILVGAELNAELEHQTRQDTTTGSEKPMGERGAEMADTLGPTRDEVKSET